MLRLIGMSPNDYQSLRKKPTRKENKWNEMRIFTEVAQRDVDMILNIITWLRPIEKALTGKTDTLFVREREVDYELSMSTYDTRISKSYVCLYPDLRQKPILFWENKADNDSEELDMCRNALANKEVSGWRVWCTNWSTIMLGQSKQCCFMTERLGISYIYYIKSLLCLIRLLYFYQCRYCLSIDGLSMTGLDLNIRVLLESAYAGIRTSLHLWSACVPLLPFSSSALVVIFSIIIAALGTIIIFVKSPQFESSKPGLNTFQYRKFLRSTASYGVALRFSVYLHFMFTCLLLFLPCVCFLSNSTL